MKTLKDYQPLIDRLTEDKESYYHYKVIPGRGLCCLAPFIYTIGLLTGIDEDGYSDRYCYPREYAIDAVIALEIWDGKGTLLETGSKEKEE